MWWVGVGRSHPGVLGSGFSVAVPAFLSLERLVKQILQLRHQRDQLRSLQNPGLRTHQKSDNPATPQQTEEGNGAVVCVGVCRRGGGGGAVLLWV